MSCTEEDYTSWTHLSGIHREMYENRMFEAGSWGAAFHPEVSPAAGEIIIAPYKNIDVFATTDLDVQLRQHHVEYLATAGMIGTIRRYYRLTRDGRDTLAEEADFRAATARVVRGEAGPLRHLAQAAQHRQAPAKVRRIDVEVEIPVLTGLPADEGGHPGPAYPMQ